MPASSKESFEKEEETETHLERLARIRKKRQMREEAEEREKERAFRKDVLPSFLFTRGEETITNFRNLLSLTLSLETTTTTTIKKGPTGGLLQKLFSLSAFVRTSRFVESRNKLCALNSLGNEMKCAGDAFFLAEGKKKL